MLIYQVAFPAPLFTKRRLAYLLHTSWSFLILDALSLHTHDSLSIPLFISFFPFSPHDTGYAIQEAITGVAVIHESPEFFYPLFATLAIAWVERLW